jgi:hypothetical protein
VPPQTAPPSPSNWFADRPLTAKFAVLVGVVVLAVAGLLGTVVSGTSTVREMDEELTVLSDARSLVLELDTRASELKVDGYKAAVREDPAEQLDELAEDVATPEQLLADLDALPLTGEPAAAVDALEADFGDYTAAIRALRGSW